MSSLISQILAGDSKAILHFYKLFSPKITRFVEKKLSRPEDVQETVNDIFLEAIDNLPKLRESNRLESWLYTIAHNKVQDFYRKNKIKSLLFSQMPFLEIVDKEVHQPEFVFEKNRIRDSIEKTFMLLSRKYRKILRLYYEENLSVKELAKKLHMSFKSAESLLFRARQSFKKTYEH